MKNQAAILFEQFLGQWNIERNIQTPEGNGVFKGQCTFIKIDDGRLCYHETGILTINNNHIDANRSYIYAHQDNRIIILYNDPHRKDEVLHELTFELQDNHYTASHCHLCGADTYDLTFTILSKSSLKMDYIVRGPHKNYAMQTLLIRHI